MLALTCGCAGSTAALDQDDDQNPEFEISPGLECAERMEGTVYLFVQSEPLNTNAKYAVVTYGDDPEKDLSLRVLTRDELRALDRPTPLAKRVVATVSWTSDSEVAPVGKPVELWVHAHHRAAGFDVITDFAVGGPLTEEDFTGTRARSHYYLRGLPLGPQDGGGVFVLNGWRASSDYDELRPCVLPASE